MSQETEWADGREWWLFYKKPRKTLAPYWAIIAILFGISAALVSYALHAEPIARADAGKFQITLHKEKCALEAVSNLPQRATWTEGGATFEGCFGIDEQLGLVRLYFSDRTVVAIPVQAFRAVIET